MKPPSKVQVGAKSYAVTVDLAETTKQDAEGVCIARYERIYLAPDLAVGAARVTLLHELIHACFDDHIVGGPFATEDVEELVCKALAPRMLDLLRRNPRLLTYLVAP